MHNLLLAVSLAVAVGVQQWFVRGSGSGVRDPESEAL